MEFLTTSGAIEQFFDELVAVLFVSGAHTQSCTCTCCSISTFKHTHIPASHTHQSGISMPVFQTKMAHIYSPVEEAQSVQSVFIS